MNRASRRPALLHDPARRASAPALLAMAALATLATACSSAPPPSAPATTPSPGARDDARADRLPAIPSVSGPLELRVSYPRDSARLGTRDRNFIFGSAGDGRARVWIDGEEVDVRPNGGFLAFLPVPDDGVYDLRATLGGEEQTLEVPVRLPDPPGGAPGAGGPGPEGRNAARIAPASVTPAGGWVARPGERVDVSFVGTPGGTAWLAFPDGERVPLTERAGGAGRGATNFEVAPGGAVGDAPSYSTYEGFFSARRLVTTDTAVGWPTLTGEPRPIRLRRPRGGGEDTAGAKVVLVVEGDTASRPLRLNLLVADPDRPRVAVGWDPDPPEQNGDRHIIARPGPGGGPYHYTWRNGVELELTGERNGIYRVRLTDDLTAWTPSGDIRLQAPGAPPPASRVSTVRMDPQPEYIDVHVALDRRLPYAVEEGERSLSLLVFGATSRVNFFQHGRTDPYMVRGEWSQPADRLFRVDLHLAGPPWGYEAFWGEGDDLVLRIKRPPPIDPARPLAGLTIGVDAGHGGQDRYTMGPTGVTEADANLGIVRALADRLEERGARVVASRLTDTTLTLVERTTLARAQDVDVWISVHNNAFPDGVNPWENNGSSVYYNHPRAAGLAWAVQAALLEEMGLRDLGVGRADLHQARFTWAPSILTENAFMMIPEQEAFLGSAEGQARIAEAHVRGLEAWLREVAGAGR